MKIMQKLTLGFMGIAVMAGIVGYISLRQLEMIGKPLYEDVPKSLSEIGKTAHLDGLAQFIRYYDEVLTQSARNYAFTQDKKWENRYKDIEPKLDAIIKKAIEDGSEEDKKFFQSVNVANLAFVAMEYEALEFVNQGVSQEAVRILESGKYWDQKAVYEKGLRDYVRRRGASYGEALRSSTKMLERAMRHTQKLIKNSTQTVLIFSICVLILATGTGILVSRSISGPIIKIKEAAAGVGKGQLMTKLNIKPKDEIGFLAETMNQMSADLKSQRERLVDKEFLDTIIGNMLESLIVTDAKGIIKRINYATLELLGYKEEDLVGQSVEKIIMMKEGEDSFFKRAEFKNLCKEGLIRDCTAHYVTMGGKSIPMSFSAMVLCSDKSKERCQTDDINLCEEEVNVVIIARNMEEINRLIESLETSKHDLKQTNIGLERAKAEVEKFSQDLEERVKERTNELAVLYEVSNTITYTSDQQQLLRMVMEALFKIIDYDICAAFLFDVQAAHIFVRPSYPQSIQYVDQVKESLLSAASMFGDEDIRARQIHSTVLPVDPGAEPKEARSFKGLKSSFNAPLLVSGKIIGMMNISSCQENMFLEDEVKFIYTVTNQVSSVIEHLQLMRSAEKSKMESMVESMNEGVIMFDEKGDIIVLNPQVRDMMEFGSEEKITRLSLEEKMKLVRLDGALEESYRRESVVEREVVMPHRKKQILHCVISPVVSGAKRIGTSVIIRDVTKEKEIDMMKTEFVSLVSHELRTPLSITKEGLSLVLDKVAGNITEKQERILLTARGNIDRLARLINNLLDVSKIEAGKMETMKVQLDMGALARQIVSGFETKAKEKNLDMRVCFPKNTMDAFADHDKMIQVFMNLINNALKFTPRGYVEVSGKLEGNDVVCTVADSGIGIPKSDLARVFTKFQQFGRVPGGGEKGTGLGLSIAKGIVEMHGGRMWVESEIEKGTKFIFTLPKFSFELLLNEFVANGIKGAQKSNARVSLVVITMLEAQNLKKPLSEKKRAGYLEEIESTVKHDLHRQGDAILRDTHRCYVLLANCETDHVSTVCSRFKQTLDDYLDCEQLTGTITLEIGGATYPDDARDSHGLLNKAKKHSPLVSKPA